MNTASAHVYLNGFAPADGQCPDCRQPLSDKWIRDPMTGSEKAGLECRPCQEQDEKTRLSLITRHSHFPSP